VLSPVVDYPTPGSLKRLEHEYSSTEELDPTWAARPIAIARHWDRTVLVLEDPGGVPLDQLLGHPLDLAFSLRLANGLSTAIDHLHRRGVIHKDIKPANILVKTRKEHRRKTYLNKVRLNPRSKRDGNQARQIRLSAIDTKAVGHQSLSLTNRAWHPGPIVNIERLRPDWRTRASTPCRIPL
jgi:serine/threonine protein kinase